MTRMENELIFLGTGNAFGHTGRRHSSYFLKHKTIGLLIDCGPSTLPALHDNGLSPLDIDFIWISHLHPDHWLGLPLLVLDDKWISKRKNPIRLIAPNGISEMLDRVCSQIYSQEEAEHIPSVFEVIETPQEGEISLTDEISIEFWPAIHGGNGRCCKFYLGDKTLSYSGDTAYSPSLFKHLIADILIHEASSYDFQIPNHTMFLDLLKSKAPSDSTIFLTHIDESIIKNREQIHPPFFIAEDNLKIFF